MTKLEAQVHVVVGGQYGSEGKGAVAAALVEQGHAAGLLPVSIRVGGPNAGHTAYDYNRNRFALRQVPVGAVKSAAGPLVIAAGSEIDIDVLQAEVLDLEAKGHEVRSRLWIDSQATIIEDVDKQAEQASGFTGKFGSTAKGIGAARARRLRREAPLAQDYRSVLEKLGTVGDTFDMLVTWTEANGQPIVIEGTQGYALGLHAGHYPYCTAGNVRVGDALAQVGIQPYDPIVESIIPWVVLRAYPIRVAGNSGPLANETSWSELNLPEERTTVTQLVRRVGHWDPDLAARAIRANGTAVNVALTMVDQVDPNLAGLEDADDLEQAPDALDWINEAGRQLPAEASIAYLGTGPDSHVWL